MENIGDKVTYVTPFKKEHGIVKSLSDERHVFVVYHCNGDWENYKNYTAARTAIEDLVPGWVSTTARSVSSGPAPGGKG